MIETKRLFLLPLTYEQVIKYAQCDNTLETELGLNRTARTISPELRDALETTILPNVANISKNYLYATIWTAIFKAANMIIGDLCIYGEPDPAGEIEIGYGTYKEFHNRGFMTEIVGGIITWTQTQELVKAIVASTDKSNAASFRVLIKNGFHKIGETETLLTWKLDMTKSFLE